jgi:hypothetical protein
MEVSGQLHAPAALPPRERAPGTHWIGGWVGPRAVPDVVVKRKIPSPRRESNPRTPIVQPVAECYTDWAITADHKEQSREKFCSSNNLLALKCPCCRQKVSPADDGDRGNIRNVHDKKQSQTDGERYLRNVRHKTQSPRRLTSILYGYSRSHEISLWPELG